MSAYSIDVNEAGFEQQVIEASRSMPVLIDFWAEWCGPCRVLKPLLEKLAAEYQGRFVLAKIDSDRNGELAQRFGVRSIPTVVAVVDGEEVDRFSGALSERAIRDFLDKLIPSHADELLLLAREELARGDGPAALRVIDEALSCDTNHLELRLLAAEILYGAGQMREANDMLAALPGDKRTDSRVAALLARLEFATQSAGLPDVQTLERRVQANEGDLDSRLAFARLLVAREDYGSALEQLLEIVRRDRYFADEAGRKTMLEVFKLLGGRGDLVSAYRRKLASALN